VKPRKPASHYYYRIEPLWRLQVVFSFYASIINVSILTVHVSRHICTTSMDITEAEATLKKLLWCLV